MTRVIDVVRKLAPRAKAAYVKAFDADGDAQIAKAGITTPRRLAHFLARCLSETGAFTTLVESAAYNRENLSDQWDKGNWHSYFANKAAMLKLAGQGEKLFNVIYGNRMGNGGPESGDGFRYRGRGPLQVTGKEAYAEYGARIGVDLVANPDHMLDPAYILLPSLFEWKDKGCNGYADDDDDLSIARVINTGNAKSKQIPNGYKAQHQWLVKAKKVIAELGWKGVAKPAAAVAMVSATAASNGPVYGPGDLSVEEVKTLQRTLRDKGFPKVGMIDGDWKTDTSNALRAFQVRAGLPETGLLDVTTAAALATTPPVAPTGVRADVTAADLRAAGSTEARANWRNKVMAWILGAPAAAGFVIEGAASKFDVASGYVQRGKEYLGDLPWWVGPVAMGLIAVAVFWNSQRATNAKVAAVRSGQDAGPAALASVIAPAPALPRDAEEPA